MVEAYILVKVEAGRDEETFEKIGKLSNIKKANATYGMYDMVIDIELSEIEELDNFVFNKVRKIPGVKETATIIISKSII
jgi:Lrp/AsnC family transcriptional regulator for asnA, asnC and gidA